MSSTTNSDTVTNDYSSTPITSATNIMPTVSGFSPRMSCLTLDPGDPRSISPSLLLIITAVLSAVVIVLITANLIAILICIKRERRRKSIMEEITSDGTIPHTYEGVTPMSSITSGILTASNAAYRGFSIRNRITNHNNCPPSSSPRGLLTTANTGDNGSGTTHQERPILSSSSGNLTTDTSNTENVTVQDTYQPLSPLSSSDMTANAAYQDRSFALSKNPSYKPLDSIPKKESFEYDYVNESLRIFYTPSQKSEIESESHC